MHILIVGPTLSITQTIAKKFLTTPDAEQPHLTLCVPNDSAQQSNHPSTDVPSTTVTHCNHSDDIAIQDTIHQLEAQFGPVNCLICCPTFQDFKPVEQLSTNEFDRTITANLRTLFLFIQAVLPSMKRLEHGTIVAITSSAATRGIRNATAFSAAESAIRGMMQSLYLDVREKNIRVMTIVPELAAESGGNRMISAISIEDTAEAVVRAVRMPEAVTISELELRQTNQ